MATTSDIAKTTKESATMETPAFYVVLMLEDAAAKGHAAAFETLRELLKDSQKKAWTPALFMRCGGDALAPSFVERAAEALELERAEAETLKTKFPASFAQRVIETAAEKLPSGLMSWVEEAKKRKGALLAASLLPEDAARALFAKLHMDVIGFSYEVLPNNADMPLAKRFVRWARRLNVLPPKIVMIATGSVAARAALEAGFQCVAVPDELTAHADYAGCQLVLDQFNDISAGELLDTLFPKLNSLSKR